MIIQELLEAHKPAFYLNRKEEEFCWCKHLTPLPQGHRAHLAEVLEEWVQEQCAEAWDACDDAWTFAHSLDNIDPFGQIPYNPYK